MPIIHGFKVSNGHEESSGLRRLGLPYVGLDDHQSRVPVCVERADGAVLMNSRGENDRWGIARRVSAVGAPVQAAIEACVVVTGSGSRSKASIWPSSKIFRNSGPR